jgi:hypothetical protein
MTTEFRLRVYRYDGTFFTPRPRWTTAAAAEQAAVYHLTASTTKLAAPKVECWQGVDYVTTWYPSPRQALNGLPPPPPRRSAPRYGNPDALVFSVCEAAQWRGAPLKRITVAVEGVVKELHALSECEWDDEGNLYARCGRESILIHRDDYVVVEFVTPDAYERAGYLGVGG